MSQLAKYAIVFATLTLILELVGIPTAASGFLSYFGIDWNAGEINTATSSIWNFLFVGGGILVSLSAAGALLVGFFTKTFDRALVIIPFIILMAGYILQSFAAVMIYVSGIGADWLTKTVIVIFGALAIGFIMVCVDYFMTGQ